MVKNVNIAGLISCTEQSASLEDFLASVTLIAGMSLDIVHKHEKLSGIFRDPDLDKLDRAVFERFGRDAIKQYRAILARYNMLAFQGIALEKFIKEHGYDGIQDMVDRHDGFGLSRVVGLEFQRRLVGDRHLT